MKKLNVLAIVSVIGILLLFSCQPSIKKGLTLNSLFSDHMVLQQQQEVMLWGKYTPKEKISVKADWGSESSTKVDEKGNWRLNLTTPEAGGPFEVSISTRDTTITLVDVMVGEVWLASGQSNMEMPLEGYLPNEPIDNNLEEIAAADYPNIRSYKVVRATSKTPLNQSEGQWKVTSPENANKFSATAYFFARKLHKELNVPIGIIDSDWGGTPVESWISLEKIKQLGEFEEELKGTESIDITRIFTFLSNFPSVSLPSNINSWNAIDLKDGTFSQTNFDDSSWNNLNLPGVTDEWDMDSDDQGAFWFRKRVSIADISSDYKFIVDGGIDDMDIVYVNGQKIGSTICWNCPREYTIPKSILIEGENTIAIRVINIAGPGGFMGQMALLSNSGERISIEGEWRYQYIARLSSFKGDQKFYLYHLNSKALAKKPAYISNMNAIFSINSANTPGVLFNGMINPLIPYGIKGAIWYQGESNVGRANQYEKIFPGMIDDWRARWNSNFPFYFVQIAPFSYRNELSPALRDAQRKSLFLSNTGMAVTMDIGDSLSIHPGNKQDVGDRLARLALANDYGVDIVASGPLYKKHTIFENKIILEFDLFGSELMKGNSGLSGFEIAGLDMLFIPAAAKIVKDKIEVFSPAIKKPKFVRYAWRDFIAGTLFNKEGLPASSFTTQD